MLQFIVSNRDKLISGLPPPVSNIPSGDVADYNWCVGTHHRDFDDQQLHETTKVYVMRVWKIPYIVADRVYKVSSIYVRDIEQYTRAYMQEMNAFLVSDHTLCAQVASKAMDTSADYECRELRLSEPVMDVLLPTYLDRDELCQYACVAGDQNVQQEVKIPTSRKNALSGLLLRVVN